MKIAKMLLKITHLKSLKTLMYQGFNLLLLSILLFLLIKIYITKNINIYKYLLEALNLKIGNGSNRSGSNPCGSKVERCYFLVTHVEFKRFLITHFSSF